jgi:N-acetylmuramic acid 6-phosphate etherase
MSIGELLSNIKEDEDRYSGRKHSNWNFLISRNLFKIGSGGRLFYIGAGTSGRLGVVDASGARPL